MLDVEQQLARVWNVDVRPLVEEAWHCHSVGAFRACITLTWAAVAADLIAKITQLADDGENDAKQLADNVRKAQAEGLKPASLRTMQDVERNLLQTATDLELVDDVTARDLSRLREDRHLCVHPSVRGLEETYHPSSESARAHLATALDSLLRYPPSQGRRILDRFQAHVADTQFVLSARYIAHTFYRQVRLPVRRQLLDLATKHALLELPASDPPGDTEVADRMAACLNVFTELDRDATRQAMAKVVQRVASLSTDQLKRTVSRVGKLSIFWDEVPEPSLDRIQQLLSSQPLPPKYPAWQTITVDQVDFMTVVVSASARAKMPSLLDTFESLPTSSQVQVMARELNSFFLPYLPATLADAGGWRQAEAVTLQLILPYAPLLDIPTLSALLTNWSYNRQCRTAVDMLGYAVDLYRRTPHLRAKDRSLWEEFLTSVRSYEEDDKTFTYIELESELNS